MNTRLILLQPVWKRRLVMNYDPKRILMATSLIQEQSVERLINDLQNLYAERMNQRRSWCLMVRCSRILRPIVPAIPHWRSGGLHGRKFDELSQSFNFLLNMKTKLFTVVALFLSLSALHAEPAP